MLTTENRTLVTFFTLQKQPCPGNPENRKLLPCQAPRPNIWHWPIPKRGNPSAKIPERNPEKETTKNDDFQRQSERRIVDEKSNFPQPNQTRGYPASFYARMLGER